MSQHQRGAFADLCMASCAASTVLSCKPGPGRGPVIREVPGAPQSPSSPQFGTVPLRSQGAHVIFCALVEFCVLFEVLFRKGDRYLILCFTGKETSHKARLIQVWSTNFLIPNLVLIPPKSCQEVETVAILIVMVADTY